MMRISQFNKRVKPTDPDYQHTILRIASDIAIHLMPFEDEDRTRIIERALEFANAGEKIRELYRMVEKEYDDG